MGSLFGGKKGFPKSFPNGGGLSGGKKGGGFWGLGPHLGLLVSPKRILGPLAIFGPRGWVVIFK